MQKRTLRDLTVSALGLGCMGMSEYYGPQDDAQSLRTLERALDLGVTFLDTADTYGWGRNETLLGRFFKDSGRREEVTLATKFGQMRGPNGERLGLNARPEYVRASCDASLKRLGVDQIDLYYLHRVDPNVPIEDTVGAMGELVQQGNVRFLGLSEVLPDTLRRANAVHAITALQTEYSLWSREPEGGLLDVCRELGVGFVPYSPLGRGFLTGQIKTIEDLDPTDARRSMPRFSVDNFGRNLDLVSAVGQLAQEKGCTPSQLALAWVLVQGNDIVPIPGTRRVKYLEENLGALDVTLTSEELKRLDEVAPVGVAIGDRYSDMSSVNR